jgi:hypothetical protein
VLQTFKKLKNGTFIFSFTCNYNDFSSLASGFPVAFALPGSAIISIGLAALTGYLYEGDSSAYFAIDGPKEWLMLELLILGVIIGT